MFTIIGAVLGILATIISIIFAVYSFQVYDTITPSSGYEREADQTYREQAGEREAEEAEGKDEEEEKREPMKPAEASSELGGTWDSYTVQINDRVLTLPCTIEDLEATGLTLDTDMISEDYVINAGRSEFIYYTDANGNELTVDVANASEEAKTIRECLVCGILVWESDLEEGGLTVLFPGGIQIGSSEADVIAKYGETETLYEDEDGESRTYIWYSEDYTSYCNIDVEEGVVGFMTLEYYLD